MLRSLLIVALSLILTAPAFAQMGVKDSIKRQLDKANNERDQQLRDNGMGDMTRNQNQPNNQPNGQPNNSQNTQPNNQQPAKTPDTGWIEYKGVDGTKVRLYVAHPYIAPDTTPSLPALIVIQEWWGVNEDITQRTDAFAAKGFFAVAVDLYNGKVTKDPKEAAELKSKLTDTYAQLRLKIGLNYLNEQVNKKIVDPKRVGVIGWCMGGEQALKLAVSDPRVKATVIYYGPLITDPTKLKNLKGPVLGVFGNDDKSPSPDDVNKFEAALKEDNIPHEILRYNNAGHAFASPSAAALGMYKEPLAKEANEKTSAWLETNLLKPATPAK